MTEAMTTEPQPKIPKPMTSTSMMAKPIPTQFHGEIRDWFEDYFRYLHLPFLQVLRQRSAQFDATGPRLLCLHRCYRQEVYECYQTDKLFDEGRFFVPKNLYLEAEAFREIDPYNRDHIHHALPAHDTWAHRHFQSYTLESISALFAKAKVAKTKVAKTKISKENTENHRQQAHYLVNHWLQQTADQWLGARAFGLGQSQEHDTVDVLSALRTQLVSQTAIQKTTQTEHTEKRALTLWLCLPNPWSLTLPNKKQEYDHYLQTRHQQTVLKQALKQWLRYWSQADVLGFSVQIVLAFIHEAPDAVKRTDLSEHSVLSELPENKKPKNRLITPALALNLRRRYQWQTVEYQRITFSAFAAWLRTFLFHSPRYYANTSPWILTPEYRFQAWGLNAAQVQTCLFAGSRYEEVAKQLYLPQGDDVSLRDRVLQRFCRDRLGV